MDIFSARLKWLREKKGYTQAKMAELIGMSRPGYFKVEQGTRELNFENLAKLPSILGESVDFMLGVIDYDKETEEAYKKLCLIISRIGMMQEQLQHLLHKNQIIDEKDNSLLNIERYEEIIANIKYSKSELEKLRLDTKELSKKLVMKLDETPYVSDETIKSIKSLVEFI